MACIARLTERGEGSFEASFVASRGKTREIGGSVALAVENRVELGLAFPDRGSCA